MKLIDVATALTIVVLLTLVFKLAKVEPPPPITYTIHVHSPYDPDDAMLVRFAGDELMCFLLSTN